MKKVLIYPICFISTCAIAKTTFYYETGGQCPVNTGLFLNPNATSCSEAVTKVTTPTASGRSFAGFYVGSTQVIDSNGNILVNSSTAPNLFDSSAETYNASAVYTGTNTITVRESNYWVAGDKYIGWYTCADFGYHMCQTDGAYVAPPAPAEGLCHSYGVNPNPNGYDYKFNSWVLGANHNTFVPASCYNGLSETCPRQDGCWCNHYSNGEIASGNSSLSNACNDSMLGPFEAVKGKFSLQNVYPFACKRFYVNGTWTDQVDVANGQIILDNSTPGQCRYRLICNEGYHSGSNGSDGHACIGVACKGLFNGNYQDLNITAQCVQNTPTTCPTMQNPDNGSINHPTPTNGTCSYTVTCDNSSNDFGYACDTTTGLCTKSCTVGSDCNNLKSQYTGAQHSLCKRCPTVSDLNIQSALNSRHINVSLTGYAYVNSECIYSFNCKYGYVSNIMPDHGSLSVGCLLGSGLCTKDELLNDLSDMQCTLACPTVEQLGIDDDLAFAHLSAQYSHQSEGACFYDFTCTSGCAGTDFTASCIPGSTCDSEHLGRDLVEGHHCTCASDCPNLYSNLNLQSIMSSLNMYDYQQNGEHYHFVDNMGCGYKFLCLTNYQNSWQPSEVYHCNPTDQNANDYCSRQYFIDQLTPNACTFRCPSVFSQGFDLGDELESRHAELKSVTEGGGDVCRYTLGCKPGYAGGDQTFTCQGVGCTRDWLLENLDNLSCSYRCPTMPNIIGHGSINLQNPNAPCNYYVTCEESEGDHGYQCNNNTNMCYTQTCYDVSDCNTLYNQYNAVASNICIKAPQNLGITADELASKHMVSTWLDSYHHGNGYTYYAFRCAEGYKCRYSDGFSSGTTTCLIFCIVGSTDRPCTREYVWDQQILEKNVASCIPE